MQGVTSLQQRPFVASDARPGQHVYETVTVIDETHLGVHRSNIGLSGEKAIRLTRRRNEFVSETLDGQDKSVTSIGDPFVPFKPDWPHSPIISFLAKRKVSNYNQNVSSGIQSTFDGTFTNLYARIDRVSSPGTKAHDIYREAVESIVGEFITTKAAPNGKEAGYHFDDDTFVTLDKMGDGIAEMVALLVELSLASNKVFVLEEPETNLHPAGLKALLGIARKSSTKNQFIIATHSNVVVRELADLDTKLFRVYRQNDQSSSPCSVEEIDDTPIARRNLLRELGYEFADFDLHEAWLFLEESSAETIIRKFLIPWFAPELKGRLRTYSAGGVDNLQSSVSEFQRLITFVHLEPIYRDRLWIRADNDDRGKEIIKLIKSKFDYLRPGRAETFRQSQFEYFYPSVFTDKVAAALSIEDRRKKREAKANLLLEVIKWTDDDSERGREEWRICAAEIIEFLVEIKHCLE